MVKKKTSYFSLSKPLRDCVMSKKLIEEVSTFRDQIPELEGLLIGKEDGTKVWADTLRDLNHDFILSSASVAIRATKKLGEALDKKSVINLEVALDEGYAFVFVTKKGLIVGFVGKDARSQLAIIKKNLETFVKKIEKLL